MCAPEANVLEDLAHILGITNITSCPPDGVHIFCESGDIEHISSNTGLWLVLTTRA